MLLRISIIIALVAALAVGILNFVMVKEKIETTERHRDEEQKAKVAALTELDTTKKELVKTTADLKTTQENLATTTTERDRAQAEVSALTKKAADLTEKLAKSTQERDEARSELAAFKATGQTPEQILNFANKLKQLQETLDGATEENRLLAKDLRKTQAKLAKYEGNWHPPLLPAELKGKILVTDPKWNFVVVDVGEDQGVLVDGEMLVNRNGRLVAKVQVRSVEKGRCIANILPGWQLSDVLEGDTVISDQPPS